MVRLDGSYDLLFSSIKGFDSQAAVSLKNALELQLVSIREASSVSNQNSSFSNQSFKIKRVRHSLFSVCCSSFFVKLGMVLVAMFLALGTC
ncbi:hypothetical protein PanWU01x14_230550 [Parasponia andersonii]|uniref:Uncharacterized protein n=1 Tax=Parasponia andersonii TaxID=3476 RepID=A0A2P5BKR3_PARAD|nr:hypothetical protein PanWU01x14_230550 [Parasponia andersonii]